VLVNTSFSVHEEQILDRAQECLRTLVDGRVDFVVTKNATYVVGEAAA
jgi:predicted NodU family carbamoyl transferase